jgi:hypothetical protein
MIAGQTARVNCRDGKACEIVPRQRPSSEFDSYRFGEKVRRNNQENPDYATSGCREYFV